jgi:putative membrane protein
MSLPPFHVHLDALAIAAGLEGLYLWAVLRVGPGSVPAEQPVSRRQLAWFSCGVLTILVAASWPVHDLGERYLLSVHMVQHTLISLVAPPMLLLGMPAWALRRLLAPRPVRAVMAQLTRPFIALVLFNTAIVVTHWPLVMDEILIHHPWHFVAHLVLFISATLMWWPVISPLPEFPTLSYPGRMLYLFLQSIVPTVPASFLTFGTQPLYSFYVSAPRIWGWWGVTHHTNTGRII